jgi:hypothetical protein
VCQIFCVNDLDFGFDFGFDFDFGIGFGFVLGFVLGFAVGFKRPARTSSSRFSGFCCCCWFWGWGAGEGGISPSLAYPRKMAEP